MGLRPERPAVGVVVPLHFGENIYTRIFRRAKVRGSTEIVRHKTRISTWIMNNGKALMQGLSAHKRAKHVRFTLEEMRP